MKSPSFPLRLWITSPIATFKARRYWVRTHPARLAAVARRKAWLEGFRAGVQQGRKPEEEQYFLD